jgi:alanine-glyoxylate transaminase / serine-glyoxylate transaminase / serine-pyruvate transaminase
MKNYEAKKPSYFATPSPQLIHALNTALTQILANPIADRIAGHRKTSDRVKKRVAELGLKQVATDPADQAHGMTAMYLPETVKATDLLPILVKKGVIFAAGIHKEIQPKYIRFGHMGVSAVSLHLHFPTSQILWSPADRPQLDPKRNDIDRALKALEDGLESCGYQKT